MKYYAGIGSREAPPDILALMEALGEALGTAGYALRSGGATGADTAFERGALRANAPMAIYLPWEGFNSNSSPLFGATPEALAMALKMAETLHPRWDLLGPGPRKMHARNCFQILGQTLDQPCNFVVCWTPDGCEAVGTRTRKTGGTATGIMLALRYGIPVFNLRNAESRIRLNQLLRTLGLFHRVELDKEPSQGNLF